MENYGSNLGRAWNQAAADGLWAGETSSNGKYCSSAVVPTLLWENQATETRLQHTVERNLALRSPPNLEQPLTT